MRLKIYQIDPDKDEFGAIFLGSGEAGRITGKEIDPSIYEEVFSGTVDEETLEDVFVAFNMPELPSGHLGRSLSVSDVIEVVDSDETRSGFYYTESIGFSDVYFDPSRCSLADGLIRTVCLLPGKPAFATEIANDFHAFQNEVGGWIEFTCPLADGAAILGNDEAKLIGMEGCRRISGEIYAGPLFIMGDDGEGECVSLTDAQIETYTNQFSQPEEISREEVEDSTGFTIISFNGGQVFG